MAVLVKNLDHYVGATAQFRAWGKVISDQLAAQGLVQTADTGQIDWNTVVAPAAADTIAGYEVWRFADALQATGPVFLKISYATGYGGSSGTGRPPAFYLAVGTSTNGAGTLSINGVAQGNFRCRSNWHINPPSGAGNFANLYISGNNARATVTCLHQTGGIWGTGTIDRPFGFNIERLKNNAGADVDDGFCINTFEGWNATPGGISQQQFIPKVGIPPPVESQPGSLGQNNAFGGYNNIDVFVSPIFHLRGRLLNPITGLVSYQSQDMQPFVPVPISMYGAAHTYLPLGPNTRIDSTAGVGAARGGVGAAFAMLWE